MIEVSMILYPHGDRSRGVDLGTLVIINDGSGTNSHGSYTCTLEYENGIKAGRVEQFPRKKGNVWGLLKETLNVLLK